MLHDLFKKKEPAYDYGNALQRLCQICQTQEGGYSFVAPSVYFDSRTSKYTVRFECYIKEYVTPTRYRYSLRRDEKMRGNDLEELLEFAITYAGYEDAFRSVPENLPEGIVMKAKDHIRVPLNSGLSHRYYGK